MGFAIPVSLLHPLISMLMEQRRKEERGTRTKIILGIGTRFSSRGLIR